RPGSSSPTRAQSGRGVRGPRRRSPFPAIASAAHAGSVFIHAHRRLRAMLLAGLLVLPLLLGGWFWFRDSSLVSVQHVQISGVRGPDALAIDSALAAAARHMTTLDIHPAALRSAVARFPVVRDVSASAGFPHTLHVHVLEQLPVAALSVNGNRTAVAGDG